MPSYDQLAGRGVGLSGDRSRTVFGQVMGLVGLTAAFAAAGAYIGRDLNSGFILFLPAFACLFALQWATGAPRRSRRGGMPMAPRQTHEQAAIAILFAFGLLIGIAAGGMIHYYALTRPTAVYQAAGTTALATLGLGAIGYTTSHDLSGWMRPLFFALIALIVFGLIASFVAIPGSNIIYCVAGIGIFSLLTVFDFWRLSRGAYTNPVMMAASIFLDVFNMFILLLSLFGGGGGRR